MHQKKRGLKFRKNSFQTTSLNLNRAYRDIASSVKFSPTNSKTIVAIGHCRSGTTYTLRLMGCSQIPSFHQPMKTILRWMMQNQKYSWTLPEDDTIFLKETIGPYTPIESQFDPLQVLLRVNNLDLANVHIIYIARDPYQSLLSWMNQWDKIIDQKILIANFINSYLTLKQSEEIALKIIGKDHIHYVAYDLSTNQLWRDLFLRLGISSPPILSNWNKFPPPGKEGSNVFFAPFGGKCIENEEHDVPLIFRKSMASHQDAKEKNKIQLNIYSKNDLSKIPKSYLKIIEKHSLVAIYKRIHNLCDSTLW